MLYVLRCTRRLLRDVARHHHTADDGVRSTTCLGDWFANRLNIGAKRFVLATSSRCLLTVVVPAKDLQRLPDRLAAAVGRLLADIGIPETATAREVAAMDRILVTTTNSRVVLGSMKDMAVQADEQLYDLPHRPGRQLHHVNAWLAQVPCRPLGYATPAEAAVRLLEDCYSP